MVHIIRHTVHYSQHTDDRSLRPLPPPKTPDMASIDSHSTVFGCVNIQFILFKTARQHILLLYMCSIQFTFLSVFNKQFIIVFDSIEFNI